VVDGEMFETYERAWLRVGTSSDDERHTFTEYGEVVVIVVSKEGVDVVSREPLPLLSLCARLPLLDFDVTILAIIAQPDPIRPRSLTRYIFQIVS
jgi:hypothetical protein